MTVSRRRFLSRTLAAAGVGLAGLSLPRKCDAETAVAEAGNDVATAGYDFGPFKMGVQSWTLRTYNFETALAHARSFGLDFIEFTNRHVPINTLSTYVQKIRGQMSQHDITPSAMGVVAMKADENKLREVFEFAKAMELQSITANPEKDAACFDLLEELVDEFQIPIAIHNHGPGATYDKSAEVLEWVEGRHKLLGGCVDCGHYLRSGERPEEIIAAMGDRVYGVHLKDAKSVTDPAEFERLKETLPKNRVRRLEQENMVMTIVGEGELSLPGVFEALQNVGYDRPISLEYEENEKNPLADIGVCLANAEAAIETATKS